MDFTGLHTWSTSHVLTLRSLTRETLAQTPHHLYPLSAEYLRQELAVLEEELSRRAGGVVIYADELEMVGDDGTLEDALWRLEQRQRD